MDKLFIFGGSFDPPHIAHYELCEFMYAKFKPEQFIILPCYKQALKNRHNTLAIHRLNMLKLMFNNKYIVSDYEITKAEVTYTIDSLNYFNNKKKDMYFLIGLDSFLNINFWKDYKLILSNYKLIVLSRDIDNKNSFNLFIKKYREFKNIGVNIFYINNFKMNISSSFIRIDNKKEFLDKKIYKYIKDNNLYDEIY